MSRIERCEIWSYSSMHQRAILGILLVILAENLALSKLDCSRKNTDGTKCACEHHQDLSISCTNNSVIHISGANYGRIDNETCNDGKHANYSSWNLTCSSPNSINVVSTKCNNKITCTVKADYSEFGGDPCSGTGKYLIVNYTCAPEFTTKAEEPSTTQWVTTRTTTVTPSSSHSSTISPIEPTSSSETSTILTTSANIDSTSTSNPSTNGDSTSVLNPSTNGDSTSTLNPSTNGDSTSVLNPSTNGDSTSVLNPSTNGDSTSTSNPSTNEGRERTTTPKLSLALNPTAKTPIGTAKASNEPECKCPNETRRNVNWPTTNCSTQAVKLTCPNNKNRTKAIRRCLQAGWGKPNLAGCITEEIEWMLSKLESLRSSFSISFLNNMTTKVENISQSNDLYGGDLYELNNVMVQLVGISLSNSKVFTESDAGNLNNVTLISVSNLLSDSYNETWNELDQSEQSITATKMLVSMEDSSTLLAKTINSSKSIHKAASEIEIKIHVINIIEADSKTSTVTFKTSDVQFDISLEDVKLRADKDGLGRSVFILYDDIEKWLEVTLSDKIMAQAANNCPRNVAVDNDTCIEPKIITKVVSASIISSQEHSDKLKKPIRFILRHKLETLNSTKISCVFWKFSKNDFVGHWSDEGCRVVSSNSENTTCECDHLTNFAVLMSAADIPEVHSFALHVITFIGCAFSIVCLVLALLTFCFFRNLQSDRNTIHKNLVFCLLIAELIFVFGITQHEKELLCAVITGFLHYFFLASFAWMCLEGAQLYILLVEVFETEKSRVKWYYLGGYGIPALIALISVSVNIYMKHGSRVFNSNSTYGAYGTKEFCWLSREQGFIWAFNGPVIAIFAVNSVMLGLAIYMMCKHASSAASWKLKDKSKLYAMGSWLRGAAILVVILGTTWIFGLGLLSSGPQSVPISYIFAILNSFQGLFIFVFHCLTNDKVQKEYQRAIQRAEWLPDWVRMRCGDLSGSGSLSTPNQPSSSGKTLFQRMFPKNKRKESMSSSLLQKTSTSSDGGVQVIFTSAQEMSQSLHLKQHLGSISESACLTDSSGVESRDFDSSESVESASGYRESVIAGVTESEFNYPGKCT